MRSWRCWECWGWGCEKGQRQEGQGRQKRQGTQKREEREMRVRLFAIYQAAEGAAIPPMSKAKRRRLAEMRVRMLIRR